jgi:hypothetical protein
MAEKAFIVPKVPGSLAALLVALLAASSSDAEAKGRLRSSTALTVQDGHIRSDQSFRQNRGLRGKLTRGALGALMTVKTVQDAGGKLSKTRRGRKQITRDITRSRDGEGTTAQGSYQKFGPRLSLRRPLGWKTGLSRNDTVTRHQVTDRATRRGRRVTRTSRRGALDTQEVVEKLSEGRVRSRSAPSAAGSRSRPWMSWLRGNRNVLEGPDSMAIGDSVSRSWGRIPLVVKRVLSLPLTIATLGLWVPGKVHRIEVNERQTPDGHSLEITTPKERVVSTTSLRGSSSRSVTTRSKNGRLREKETTEIWRDVGVSKRAIKRRNGTTKKVIETKVTADGTRSVTTTKLRRDKSVRRVSVKASSPRADKPARNNWVRSRTSFRRGTDLTDLDRADTRRAQQRFHLEAGRTRVRDGRQTRSKTSARLETPIGTLGKRKIHVDGSGQVTSSTSR